MSGHKKFKIFHNRFFLTIILLFLLEPYYFESIEILDNIYKYGSFALTLILIIIAIKYNGINKSMIWTFSYFGIILISTFINNPSNIMPYMKSEFSALAMCMVFSIWMNRNPRVLIESFSIFELYIYINIFTIIIFPFAGSYYETNWFLGFKNFHIRTILPIVCMSLFRSYMNAGCLTIRVAFLLFASALTFVINESATSLVGFAIFLGLLFFFQRKEKELPWFVNLKTILIVIGIIFFIIVINQDISMFSFLIENVLERNLTLTSRTRIWNLTFMLLTNHMIIGYGFLSPTNFRLLYSSVYNHPHNYILYNMMSGGVVLLITLLVGYILAHNKLKNNTNKIYGKIVLFCLCSFLVMGIAESITNTIMLYPMLILAMESDKLDILPYEKSKRTIKFRKVVKQRQKEQLI